MVQTSYSTTPEIKPSPIFFVLVATTLFGAWLTTANVSLRGVGVFIFVVAGWLVSLTLHEFAHAFVAWRSGDHSVEQRGYLSLDLRRYTNPIFSVLMPVVFIAMGGFALPGGAVLIDRSKLDDRQATKMALAGPLTNLALGVLSLGLIGSGIVDFSNLPDLESAIAVFGFFQIFVFIINMLPIPGLDGYAAIEPSLPESLQKTLWPVRSFGFMILIMILIYDNPIGNAISDAAISSVELFGVSRYTLSRGLSLMRFW